jgi:regulation of enolase protein 1 (concanavalin A-like superfamily)
MGNGAIAQMVYYVHPGYLGQTQESGRDQGHNTLSIALVTTLCEMAWNQGVDLYGYDNNRVLAACEYTAKGNLIQSGTTYYTVPFAPYAVTGFSTSSFSTQAIGNARPAWALIYNHYVNRKGLAAPYTQKFTQLVAPEQGGCYPNTGGTWDQLGYGTLLFTRDPVAAGSPPSGLSAVTTAGQIVLSWWGSASATSYTVKRGASSGGPYTVVATGITDLLTWTDAGAPDGTSYYVVTAVTPTGETAPSNEVAGITGTRLRTSLQFDEASGTTANDATGNGGSALLSGGASWATGRQGQGSALALNGNGAYASLPPNIMDTVGDFTIATWVYWNGGQNFARIFDFGSSSVRYMYLSPRTDRGTLEFAISLTGWDGAIRINAPTVLPYGQWLHVAVTLSGTTCTLYLNGAPVATSGNVTIQPFQVGHTTQNWIGRSQSTSNPTFNGLIDDFRIYDGALAAADIKALSGSTLPTSMFDVDVGAVGVAGSASMTGGVYTLQGSGADVWANTDAFHFAPQCRTGDGTITVRVASQANTNVWAKSGVMMRATLDGNAQHVMVVVTPGNGVQMTYRSSASGGSTQVIDITGIKAPCWVRLTRAGNTFTGFMSPDGVNWTQLGSASVNLPATVFSGLMVLSHNNQALNVSTFDNLSFA